MNQIAKDWVDYEVIDTGNKEKLERWNDVVLRRPDPVAIWPIEQETPWNKADAVYHRSNKGGGSWEYKKQLKEEWTIAYKDLRFKISPTGFKHTGLFPEQASNWDFMMDTIRKAEKNGRKDIKILNLFAYTGGATLAARAAGAEVTHVDSVKQVVSWARENMEQSGLDGVRWIVEDAMKFVQREVRRGNRYHGIILDPPAYGRGANGEKWVLEEHIGRMLECCAELLDRERGFLVLNLYSMGLSALLARTAVRQCFGSEGGEEFGELYFDDRSGKSLPLGTFCRFAR